MGSPSAQATGCKAGSVPVMTVDLAALFAELADSQTQTVEGYTTEEIAERIGKCQAVVGTCFLIMINATLHWTDNSIS